MTISKSEKQYQWSSSNSVSVSAGGNETSDFVTHSTAGGIMAIQLKAKNDGTPAPGDHVDFFLLSTLGDPDGSSTNEYQTAGHGTWLRRLDTNTEDPAIEVVAVSHVPLGSKIYAVNNSSGRAITVSAIAFETLG